YISSRSPCSMAPLNSSPLARSSAFASISYRSVNAGGQFRTEQAGIRSLIGLRCRLFRLKTAAIRRTKLMRGSLVSFHSMRFARERNEEALRFLQAGLNTAEREWPKFRPAFRAIGDVPI